MCVCARARPCVQDHPDDRAWLKLVFDMTAVNGELPFDQVGVFLDRFYRRRYEGATLSGSNAVCPMAIIWRLSMRGRYMLSAIL